MMVTLTFRTGLKAVSKALDQGIDPYEVKDIANEAAWRLGTGYHHGQLALSVSTYETLTRFVMEELAARGRLRDA